MSETTDTAPRTRIRALVTVVLGTIGFFLIVGLVSRGLEVLLHRHLAETAHVRATLSISGSGLGEILALILLLVYLRRRGKSLSDLGWGKSAPLRGWLLAALFTALYLWMTFAAVLRGGAALSEMSLFHIYNALVAGLVAGFVEEVFYRGFVMNELQWSGFGAAAQIAAGSILFGVAHSGWGFLSAHANWSALIGSLVATSILGLFYAITYLASRRSLMPSIAGHAVLDVLIEPWLVLSALAPSALHLH